MDDIFATLFGFAAAALVFSLVIWLYLLLPMQMARARNRSAVVWVLVSLFLSPLVAIIGLALLGDAA